MLDEMKDSGRKPARILIGNEDAAELEQELNEQRCLAYTGLWGEEVAPPLPYLDVVNLKDPATLFDVPMERVDQPRLIGVIAEGFEG